MSLSPIEQPATVLTKTEAEEALPDIVKGTRGWYWEQTFKWERMSRRVNFAALAVSSITTIVAAFPIDKTSEYAVWLKWGVVALSALSTLLSTILTKIGIASTAQLREQGRNAIEVLTSKAVIRLMGRPMTNSIRSEYFESLIDEVGKIETKFGFWRGESSRRTI